MGSVRTGLDRITEHSLDIPGRGRIALLCNAGTVNREWKPTAEVVAGLSGVELIRILAPQHGFRSEKQDNMIESSDSIHPTLGVPISSLYSHRREPADEDFDTVDALVIDLQDVGTRVYTFLTTALWAIRAAKRCGLSKVILLDRPNPIGGTVEGPVLDQEFVSFVGSTDVPMRHGLTAAEFCIYASWRNTLIEFDTARRVTARARGETEREEWIKIVPLDGWRRSFYYDETALPWTMPSPNMPTLDTAIVYPGQVALEGTNLSEGRGTARPFELFGAPFLDVQELNRALASPSARGALAGAHLREVAFEPTFQKHAGQLSFGYQVHVHERLAYRPILATTAILSAIARIHPDAFRWSEPPYEYDETHLPIDLIYGTDRVRRAMDDGAGLEEITREWHAGIAAFEERIGPLRIYGD